MGKLNVTTAKNAKPGRHADGMGLYLLVKDSGARSWMLRVQVDGIRRDIGLGGYADLTLAEAREKAAELRKVARTGADPIEERDKDRSPPPTFKVATIACHKEMSKGWTAKHAAAFLSALEAHAYPKLGRLRVDQIKAANVREALAPIWTEKPVTARKLRQRIGMVLNYSMGEGWRKDEAPGKAVTIGLSRQVRPGNFSAMPYQDVPSFVSGLHQASETIGRMALVFTILTAARSIEVRSARWSHIDLERKLWTRPAALMKSRTEHAVTLSDGAVEILKRAQDLRVTKADCLIFPGKGGKPMSDMTLTAVARKAGCDFTVHGFRSSFRDWAAEQMPTIPGEVAEAALAHAVKDATERAYRRAKFMDMRRQLLDAWSAYTLGTSNVVRLAAA